MQVLELLARRHLKQAVPDPRLRAKLTPNFRMGCKRILISNDYLPAIARDNVELVTDAIREIRAHAIVTDDGREHPVDAIVFGTGFHVADMPFAQHVRGRAGQTLSDNWQGSPEAHLGTTVAGFPNLFLLLGPGTGVGHTSVLYMLESQLELLIGALEHMRKQRIDAIEPRREVQAAYVRMLQERMAGTVWTAGGCASWYLDQKGRNSALWPVFTFSFRKQARFRPEQYVLTRRSAAGSESDRAAAEE
jgi:cation diffusion facilitator CzcD-associated flavoprotein CzcO